MKSPRCDSDTGPKSAWLLLGAILLLVAGLRLTRLGLGEFKYDEATTARLAVAITREGRFPIVGPGQTFAWTINWRGEGKPPARVGLQWFNHLVDKEGMRWGQGDGVGLPVSDWRYGDTIVAWFDIFVSPDAPPPPYLVRTGLYTYPDVANLPLVDANGDRAAQFLELGPINAQ